MVDMYKICEKICNNMGPSQQRSVSTTSTMTAWYANTTSERTLAIIKPEAFVNAEDIEDTILNNDFAILARRIVQLTPEQAAELYKGHYGTMYFPHLVAHMSQGPIMPMVLAGNDCVRRFTKLMGPAKVAEAQAYWPESLRACYGRRHPHGDYFNGIHGSSTPADAIREIHFFFPQMRVGPLLRGTQIHDYIVKNVSPTLLPCLNALVQERPDEPILWLAEELRKRNPNEPEQAPVDELDDPRCHTPPSDVDSLDPTNK